jgi:hypothetical protein
VCIYIYILTEIFNKKGTGEENGGEKEKASNSVFNQKYHQFRIEEVFNE